MAKPAIVDWDKVRALKEKLTPSMYEGTAYDGEPNPDAKAVDGDLYILGAKPEKAEQRGADKVATQPADNRQQPASRPKVGRAPAKPAVPEPAAQLASTTPAKLGASGEKRDVPRETAPKIDPIESLPAFEYTDDVEAGIQAAMERGRPDIAEMIQKEYGGLITSQFRLMEQKYEAEVLPRIQKMQKDLLAYREQAMPQELVMQANQLATEASAQQRRMLAYAYGLERNALTQGAGIALFNQAKFLEPGVQLDRLQMGDMQIAGPDGKPTIVKAIIGVDADGNQVNFKSGEPFIIPVDEAEALYNEEFPSQRTQRMIVPEGGKVIDTATGAVIASNPKAAEAAGGTRSEQLSAVNHIYKAVAGGLGLTLGDNQMLMNDIGLPQRQAHARLVAEAGQLVREKGIAPEEAARLVLERYWEENPEGAEGEAATSFGGAPFWRR